MTHENPKIEGEALGMELTSVTGYNVDRNVNSLDWSFAMGARTQAQYGVSGILFVGHPDTSKFAQEVRLAGAAGSRADWLTGVFYTKERVNRFSGLPTIITTHKFLETDANRPSDPSPPRRCSRWR